MSQWEDVERPLSRVRKFAGLMDDKSALPRFTILIHAVGGGFARPQPSAGGSIAAGPVHWDWLFQPPGDRSGDSPTANFENRSPSIATLWTWATDPLPELDKQPSTLIDRITTPALRLADHRERYLDFEGDIGAGRGSVRPLVTGRYEVKRQTASCFEARLRWTGSPAGLPLGADAEVSMLVRFSRSDGGASEPYQAWTATLFCEQDT